MRTENDIRQLIRNLEEMKKLEGIYPKKSRTTRDIIDSKISLCKWILEEE